MSDAPILPGAARRSLERVAIRMRESPVTTSGWRLDLDSARGAGAIVRAERGDHCWYRGEGACLGLTQQQLDELYRSLQPDEESHHDFPQLG